MASKNNKKAISKVESRPNTKREFMDVYYPTEFLSPEERTKVSKNPLWLILCFFVPFIFLGICYAINDVIPFGDRTIFYGDFKAQYYPFIQEFQDKLQNGGSLLWTWNSGLGSNFVGMIGYYISSPMYLLLAFVPQKFLIIAINLLMMTKFGLCGLFTGLFLKNVYKRNDISLVAFSLGYAFSSFMMGYNWNILWLDTVALLPLVALGVYKFVYEKKFKVYIIALALGLIANYYIGYMLCVFTLIWFFILWAKYPKKHRTLKRFTSSLFSIAGFTVIALSLTAFLMIPAYLQLQASGSTNDTGLDKVKFFHSFFEVLGNTLGFNNATRIEADGLPNIYGGVICIALFIIFARCKKIPLAERLADLGFVAFVFLSLNWSPLDFMWHGFHEPNQIPSRFAFIFVFLMLIISYRAFTLIKYINGIDLIISACFAGFVLLCGYAFEMNILYSALVIAIYLVFIWLYQLKVFNEKVLVVLMSVIMIAEMFLNCKAGVKYLGTFDSNYPKGNEEVTELLADIEEKDTDFYRMEQTYLSSKNDGMYYGYHGMGQFSSTINKDVLRMASKLGMVSLKLSFQTYHTSPVISSMFNLKYYIARNNGFIAHDPTLTEVSRKGSTTLYQYKYYLPLGFMADSALKDFNLESYNADPIIAQNALFKAASGISDDVFTRVYAQSYSINSGTITCNDVKNETFSYNTGAKGKIATVKYIADKDGEYYAYVNVRDDSKKVTVKSSSINNTYDVDSKRYLMPVGNYKAGEEIEFSVTLSEAKKGSFKIYVAYFDEAKFAEGYELLNDETMTISYYDDTTVEGKVTAEKDTLLYTSIPYEDGWKVYVDGVEAEKLQLTEGFTGVELTKGAHDIRFEYCPKGLKVGIVISVIGVVAFIAICVLEILKKKKEKGSDEV